MSRQRWATLILSGMVIAAAAGFLVRIPGYMDAEYYFATAGELAQGRGFSEPFLWNYLDDPAGIPHPSHLYWMPLTSVLSAGPMAIFNSGFRAGQLVFLLLTAALPVFTSLMAESLHLSEDNVWKAGLLALFPGFYLSFLVTTDSFAPFAYIGAGALWVMAESVKKPTPVRWFGAGLLIGLAHLTRADGILFFAPALLGIYWAVQRRGRNLVALLTGYILMILPWWIRNLQVSGALFGPGSGRALWLVDYDQLFSYPGDQVSFTTWWQSGCKAILSARLSAIWMNFKSLLAVNGLIYLAPLILLGAKRLWRESLIRLTSVYLAVLFLFMSFIFPFAGERGAFFHSSSALMPIFWSLAPVGLEVVTGWAAARRQWQPEEAIRVLGAGMIVLAAGLSAGIFWHRIIGSQSQPVHWGEKMHSYEEIGEQIIELDSSPGIAAVNDPPGFYLATGFSSVVIPNGDSDALWEVVHRYDVRWIVLDSDRPTGLETLYDNPTSLDWLKPVDELLDIKGMPIYLLQVDQAEIMP